MILGTFQSDIYSELLLNELQIASKYKLENRCSLFKKKAAIVDGNNLEKGIIKKYFLIEKTYAVVSAEALKMALKYLLRKIFHSSVLLAVLWIIIRRKRFCGLLVMMLD
jgi:hypothetical protein